MLDTAVDGAGNVYVADGVGGAYKMPPSCLSSASTLASCVITLPVPPAAAIDHGDSGIAVDKHGNVFIYGIDNWLYEIPAGCTTVSCVVQLGGSFGSAQGIAVDTDSNVYIADQTGGAIWKIPQGCTAAAWNNGSGTCTVSRVDNGAFNAPKAIALDGTGNLYVMNMPDASGTTESIREIPTTCTSASCVLPLFSYTFATQFFQSLAVDGPGNIYAGIMGSGSEGEVWEIPRTTTPGLSYTSSLIGVQSTDSPKAATIQNIGNEDLAINLTVPTTNPTIDTYAPAAASGSFMWDPGYTGGVMCSSSTATVASATCDLPFDFKPTTSGAITALAHLFDNSLNATNAEQDVPLQATGLEVPGMKVSGDPNASVYGTAVAITATLTVVGATPPTGTVTFTEGADVLGSCTLTATSAGTCS
jgi:hypothetical protein